MHALISRSLLLLSVALFAPSLGNAQGIQSVTLYTPPMISNTAGVTPFFCSLANVGAGPIDVAIEVIIGGTSQNSGTCTDLPAG